MEILGVSRDLCSASVLESIRRLTLHGITNEKEMAEGAIVDTQPHAVGRCRPSEVQLGEQTLWCPFSGQTVILGGLVFRAIDYRGAVLLGPDAKRRIGRFVRKELYQCALRHLSDAMLWAPRGKKKIIPNRAEIFSAL